VCRPVSCIAAEPRGGQNCDQEQEALAFLRKELHAVAIIRGVGLANRISAL
jgi:hypothetical protein